ncbi:MBL fold metallo-hydrolase [Rosenbergiella sp. S61]|uniref:MBL fold metallo-hydrolase n=1 Tax=Rosenbergiella gaditana TaxID=2726987 RepID=A0ABS5SVV5_9GAMM|nr:MBL fold metallo-hydrolase [Rosenbergiella gaditana]MBT0722908.1 MBL fold metallo-hydrolase [Rosenbergiella gaditana]
MITLCNTCGTSYNLGDQHPESCKICEDERQYVPVSGQKWIEFSTLVHNHSNKWKQHQENLFSLQTVPSFAIGQRAFLIRTAEGNILWDCIACLDEATKALIHSLGGLKAIALSHPHFYSTMQDWAEEFDAPLYLHSSDQQWINRDHKSITLWEGDTFQLTQDIHLLRLGGHFTGGSVLYWSKDEGILLAGDIIQITPGADAVSFMWSYPNHLPLSAKSVSQINHRLQRITFSKIYGAFEDQDILREGNKIVRQSSEKYIACLG